MARESEGSVDLQHGDGSERTCGTRWSRPYIYNTDQLFWP